MIFNKNISPVLDNSLVTKMLKNRQIQGPFFIRVVLTIFFLAIFFVSPCVVSGQSYTFTLTKTATTSAGVYNNLPTDSSLVRTLWTAVKYNAGTYNISWDGKDDLGNLMPAGNYLVKVVSNNVQYSWVGIIGNTSAADTGSTVFRGYYYCMTGMAVANGEAYYCSGYSERTPSVGKFLTSDTQHKIGLEAFNQTTANTDIVTTDGKNVYYAAYDAYAMSNTFVYAYQAGTDADVFFANGINYRPAISRSYNVIGYQNLAGSYISGIAVQKAGNLLFISRKNLNQLSVLDKGTGKLLQTISINQPKALCVDMNDNLWMVSDSNVVSKYKVGTNGVLSSPLLTVTSVLAPIAIAVSPDNTTLTIADGALSSQQVKGFDNSTGRPTWVLGTAGGYINNAAVTNNKFYFNDVRGKMYYNSGSPNFLEFIAYQSDGSFWVNDPGNYRVQHYSASRTYIETIMSMGSTYSTWADKNDNTRVGAEYLEFAIDNTKPLTGNTGWRLVRNWGATVPATYDHTAKITNFITLTSKGVSHTYGFLRMGLNYSLVEFQSNNVLRFTGVTKYHCNIDRDGSLLTDNFTKYAFLGFDSANNPIWAGQPTVLSTASIASGNPLLPNQWVRNTYLTSSGKIVLFDYGIYISGNTTFPFNTGYHLGAIQTGSTNFLWKTALATHRTYSGLFPDPSRFDIGNLVNNYAGSSVMVFGQNVIMGYHGEFWKNSQTNKFNHYWDNGLAIGQFGVTGPETFGEAPAMMAGNALSPQLVYGSTADELYLYHGDESFHSGVHKWKISGLSTIAEQDIPIVYPFPQAMTAAALIIPGNNLMVNLPYSVPLLNNTSGWTINPTLAQTGWSIKTNSMISGTQTAPDIYLSCTSSTGSFSLNRDLGNNSGLVYWALAGKISYFGSNQAGMMTNNFDVVDNSGKIIARLTNKFVNLTGGGTSNTIYWNNKVLATGSNTTIQPILNQIQPVQIVAVNNLVTITYAGHTVTAPIFDPTADISSPKTMRAYITGGYNPTPKCFDFQDMWFYTSKTNQTISFNPITTRSFGTSSFPIIAWASSNLPTTFSVVSGPARMSGNLMTLTGIGTVVIQISQNGNYAYNAANPVILSFVVSSLNITRIDL